MLVQEILNKIPECHRNFLTNNVMRLIEDKRIIGIGLGGSLMSGISDKYSDIDLTVVIDSHHYNSVMSLRHSIVSGIGNLLSGFTGEHVGEPRLMICLYESPLLHVDYKFIDFADFENRNEDPLIIWERNFILSNELNKSKSNFPKPDIQWIEDRFWVWIHYGASKIARGELFDALDMISFLRFQVLGPMALHSAGFRPMGVRRVEKYIPNFANRLKLTLADHNPTSCAMALKEVSNLYISLRDKWKTQYTRRETAEKQSLEYLLFISQDIISKNAQQGDAPEPAI